LRSVCENVFRTCRASIVDIFACDTYEWAVAEKVLLDLIEDTSYSVRYGDVAFEEVLERMFSDGSCGDIAYAS